MINNAESAEKSTLQRFNVSFYPPREITDIIMNVNEELRDYWADDYVLETAHLTLYYAAVPLHNIGKLMESVKNYAEAMKDVEVVIGDVVVKEDDYIMLDIQNKLEIASINSDLVALIKPLREGQIMQKYKDRWDTYSEEKKRIIIETGHQYPYESHLTLAKVNKESIEEAMEKVRSLSLTGTSFKPSTIRLGISEDGGVTQTGHKKYEYKIGH